MYTSPYKLENMPVVKFPNTCIRDTITGELHIFAFDQERDAYFEYNSKTKSLEICKFGTEDDIIDSLKNLK